MRDTPRYAALELAVSFARDFDEITTPGGVVEYATTFHDFLTADNAAPAAPAKPAKPAAKPVKETPPASEAKPEAPAETPAAKQPEQKAADAKPAPTKKAEPEVSAADTSKAVVKLVTKIGRDPAIQWMQKNFGSPNVSGLDTSKHSYASVIAKIQAHIAELEKPAEETSPAE